ncbi:MULTISPECIES: FecR domain-containing protein [Pseudanabaena]|uniref:FecR protein n=2 Tax=Pseudanabaena TaxID=1152 RepID=L8N2D4_9CYAN|nr:MULTISPECIES: FecR domain-containing protein [Pseudanabaena]ELS32428.1 FecR protein [Pseudanabaena biceps PCC 7429]MDG3495350.1 FecR domain-containing protein [Pseudanabaena catenata USMAC16]
MSSSTSSPASSIVATPTASPANQLNVDGQSAKVTEILDGDEVFIRDRKAAVNDVAKSQEQVRTGESRAEIEFNNNAIARLSKNSLLTVGKCGAQLQKGSVLINGAVSACTSSISAAVRGTTYLLEVDEQGNDQIQVLEGEVAVTRNEPNPQVQLVRSGERLRNFRKDRRLELQKISQSEYERLLSSPAVKGFRRDLPSLGKVQAKFQALFPSAKLILDKKNNVKEDVKKEIKNLEQRGKDEVDKEIKKLEPRDLDRKELDKLPIREPIKDVLPKLPSRP